MIEEILHKGENNSQEREIVDLAEVLGAKYFEIKLEQDKGREHKPVVVRSIKKKIKSLHHSTNPNKKKPPT